MSDAAVNQIALLRGQFNAVNAEALSQWERATLLPAAFADSTHQIWLLQQGEHKAIMKLADLSAIRQQTFWQGVNTLFAWDLAQDYRQMDWVYRFWQTDAVISVPKLRQIIVDEHNKSGLINEYVAGQTLSTEAVCEAECRILARHLLAMHHQPQTGIGLVMSKSLAPFTTFQSRLRHLLDSSPRLKMREDNEMTLLLLRAIETLCSEKLIPMVLDLRWDQFLKTSHNDLVLVDVDATVCAPVEMNWLLLESVLSAQQLRWILTFYRQQASLPNVQLLQGQRLLYRAVFCALDLLGEQDWQWWQSLPPTLDSLLTELA